MRTIKTSILFIVLVCGIEVSAQTLQQVTDNGATTSNGISVAHVTSNSHSLAGANLPTEISSLNGYRINGSIPDVSHNGITYQSGGGGGAAIGFFRGGNYDTGMDFYTNYNGGYAGLQHRMRIASNGNVGIGTTSPGAKLHIDAGAVFVSNSANSDYLLFDHKGLNSWRTRITTDNASSYIIGNDLGGAFNNRVLTLAQNGNIGFGTTYPNGRLDVNGAILLPGSAINTISRPPVASSRITGEIAGYSATGLGADDGFLRLSAGGGTNSITKTYIDLSGFSTVPDMRENIILGTGGAERMRITGSGYVGIGTTNPREALSVNGKIRALEIKVEASPWPDYVFNSDYSLPSLEETEKHIKEKGHLRGIPSAAEVKANGIELGEMNAKLLQKIEELTLHLINENKLNAKNMEQVNRCLERLKQNNTELRQEIERLKKYQN